ncbi:ABC transporter permease [Haloarcula salinisoli]|uniref:ABC transporter permease n=1 Tax=Haloarcula salinisoli TaxID=2487746 RepID=A0A8J8CA51_9EURY|nr:ABC transporter permease [Halomicroarcula salinisoli]MBX0288608.1 ABC transporter permease [Halomicroarcula salinisoli]MBX0306012.1 ABC transporter permease [Halomicroarcula salinisoli]
MTPAPEEFEVSGAETAERASGSDTLTDVWFSLERWLVKTTRNPFVTFSSLVQPVIFFVLMAEVVGAIASGILTETVGDIHYVSYLTPAITIQSALAAAAVSGIGLVDDIETGMFDKLLASPMHRSAMFLGKILSEVIRIAVQTVIILLLGFGLLTLKTGAGVGEFVRTGLLGIVGIIAVAVLFGGVFMAFSNVVALITRDREATIMIANLLTFPLLFVSSAFVPLAALPNWIQTLAVVNPITYGVDAIRALLLGRGVASVVELSSLPGLWGTVAPAVAVLLGFNIVLGGVAVSLLNRASRAAVK